MESNEDRVTTRAAGPEDVDPILGFIRELAEYEKLSHEVKITREDLMEHLFGEKPVADAFMGCLGDEPVGYALIFTTFGTFSGRPGIYIEDIYVQKARRGRGVGAALFSHVVNLAKKRKCGRLEWTVLNWNTPAMNFYEKFGGKPLSDWSMWRINGPDFT